MTISREEVSKTEELLVALVIVIILSITVTIFVFIVYGIVISITKLIKIWNKRQGDTNE